LVIFVFHVRIMARPQRFCIFCDGPGLSKTHIWPDWLERLLGSGTHRTEEFDANDQDRKSKLRQGGLFTQKPYLTCESCNTGWMAKIEGVITSFARPIFASFEHLTILNARKQRALATWIALVTILAEYIDHKRGNICVPKADREY